MHDTPLLCAPCVAAIEAIKREMNYLVYLGALLGFIIGIINIFV